MLVEQPLNNSFESKVATRVAAHIKPIFLRDVSIHLSCNCMSTKRLLMKMIGLHVPKINLRMSWGGFALSEPPPTAHWFIQTHRRLRTNHRWCLFIQRYSDSWTYLLILLKTFFSLSSPLKITHTRRQVTWTNSPPCLFPQQFNPFALLMMWHFPIAALTVTCWIFCIVVKCKIVHVIGTRGFWWREALIIHNCTLKYFCLFLIQLCTRNN